MLKRLARALLPTRLLGWIRTRRIERAIRRFSPRVVRHTYGMGDLSVYLSDGMAEVWYDTDWPELPEIALLRQHRLRPGATVFDLGAHQAVVAMMLAREVGPAGRVIAVEPSEHNLAAARKNIELNAMTQLSLVPAAVSDRPGTLVFNRGMNSQKDDGSGAWGKVEVRAITADEIAAEYGVPDVVFIDVEGLECQVLRGAEQVLRRQPDWFIEVHVRNGLETFGGSVPELLAHFPSEQYEVLVRREADDDFRPLTADDAIVNDRFFLVALARAGTDRS